MNLEIKTLIVRHPVLRMNKDETKNRRKLLCGKKGKYYL